jgi:hypothetical protein
MTRGLLRLWIVATALWAAPALLLIWAIAQKEAWRWATPEGVAGAATLIAGPPLLVLAIGAALVWAIRGEAAEHYKRAGEEAVAKAERLRTRLAVKDEAERQRRSERLRQEALGSARRARPQ